MFRNKILSASLNKINLLFFRNQRAPKPLAGESFKIVEKKYTGIPKSMFLQAESVTEKVR